MGEAQRNPPLIPRRNTKAAAAAAKQLGGDILGDIFASAEYRKAVAPVYVKRALAAAFQRAS